MSLSNGNGDGMVMPVSPMYGNGGMGDGMFGNGGWWILLLFILLGGNNGWGNGYGANGGTAFVANDVQRGFDQASLTSGINGLSTGLCNGFSNVQQSLCNGFAGVNQAVANGFAQAEIANNARQMADMNQAFALQSQLSQCCCDNRMATVQTQNVVATEGAATRLAIQEQTQAILDKMCQQEIDALKTQNENLRTQLNMANLAASQTAQTGALIADNASQTQYIVNRVAPYPIPSYTVPNPFGTTTATAAG